MIKLKWMLTAGAALLLTITSAMVASAQSRAFVSSGGSDSNPCTVALPCRNFQQAVNTVATGGEVVALDSAGYGTVVINKAVTIDATGVYAGVAVPASGTGITVSAGATDSVVLTNLQINGLGAASTTGISHTSGKLVVQKCRLEQLTIGLATSAKMDMIDCIVANNATGAQATGEGSDPAIPSFVATQTSLRIISGSFTGNTTALTMINPGNASCCSVNKINIFLFSPGQSNAVLTNFAGNGTFMSGSGTGCGGSNCTQATTYQFGSGVK